MFSITYIGVDGSVWDLDGDGAGTRGAFTATIEGLVGAASVGVSPGPGRIGVRATGIPAVKPFTGTLNVILTSRLSKYAGDLQEITQAFRRAWSTLADGELVVQGRGLRLRTSARLAEGIEFPTRSPADPRLTMLEVPVRVECYDGVWFGTPEDVSNGLVVNAGELVAWPKVEWTGTGTITAPGAAPLDLPSTPVPAVIDCDKSTGCVITVDGVPAPALWSQLRGRTFPVGVPADSTAQWQFSQGLTATVTARVLDPWRW